MTVPSTRDAQHRDAATLVAHLLRGADFTEDGIRGAGGGASPSDRHVFLKRLRPDEPLATLVRLFVLGITLDPVDVARHLGGALDALTLLGLVERSGSAIRPSLRVTPWEGQIVAHDANAELQGADHVIGPNPAGSTLARLTVRTPVRTALDLGTGPGIQALLAARHSDQVVATDINPRALMLTELNASLNGIETIETRVGSFFEPVAADRFDLIASNPPYVISPEHEYMYRDSDLPRDHVSRAVVRGASAHLAEGGIAVVLTNWIEGPGHDRRAAIESWTEGSGCDVLVVHYATEDALAYAMKWHTGLRASDASRYGQVVDRWMQYYHKERIEAIASGAVVLRRRPRAANGVGAVHMEHAPSAHAGAHILAIFAGRDYLAALANDESMLEHTFRPADGDRLDQSLLFRGNAFGAGRASLVRPDGLGVRGRVEPRLVRVLARLDGKRRLGSVVDEAARDGGGDVTEMRAATVRMMRMLLEIGLIEPRTDADPIMGPVDSRIKAR